MFALPHPHTLYTQSYISRRAPMAEYKQNDGRRQAWCCAKHGPDACAIQAEEQDSHVCGTALRHEQWLTGYKELCLQRHCRLCSNYVWLCTHVQDGTRNSKYIGIQYTKHLSRSANRQGGEVSPSSLQRTAAILTLIPPNV